MSTVEKVDIEGCLIEEDTLQYICDQLETMPGLCPAQAVVDTGLTYVSPSIHRRAYRGTDERAARCDQVHEARRINPAPLQPVPTYAGIGAMTQSLRLDAWSNDREIEFAFRSLVDQPAGQGWGYIVIPNIAGFQRPIITLEGTYRTGSTAVQEDEPGGQGGDGSGPRGPYMGQEAHHWSSTQRIYIGYFRRDNPLRMYVDYRMRYICS